MKTVNDFRLELVEIRELLNQIHVQLMDSRSLYLRRSKKAWIGLNAAEIRIKFLKQDLFDTHMILWGQDCQLCSDCKHHDGVVDLCQYHSEVSL